jgi:hypothetical protein
MNKVYENVELFALLTSKGFEFMRNYYYVSSEGGTFGDYEFVMAFLNLNVNFDLISELNEEQSLYNVNSSISIIRGTVTILLIKN